jgi:hypothetical protein
MDLMTGKASLPSIPGSLRALYWSRMQPLCSKIGGLAIPAGLASRSSGTRTMTGLHQQQTIIDTASGCG